MCIMWIMCAYQILWLFDITIALSVELTWVIVKQSFIASYNPPTSTLLSTASKVAYHSTHISKIRMILINILYANNFNILSIYTHKSYINNNLSHHSMLALYVAASCNFFSSFSFLFSTRYSISHTIALLNVLRLKVSPF